MPENRKANSGMMVVAALLTLALLAVVGFVDQNAMLLVAGGLFVVLGIRFIWLVWRELK